MNIEKHNCEFILIEAEEEDKKCANELSPWRNTSTCWSAVNEGLSEAMNELDAIQRE